MVTVAVGLVRVGVGFYPVFLGMKGGVELWGGTLKLLSKKRLSIFI